MNGGYELRDFQTCNSNEDKYVERDDLIFAWSATFGPFIWRGWTKVFITIIYGELKCFKKEYKHFLYNYLNRVTKKVSSQGSGSIFASYNQIINGVSKIDLFQMMLLFALFDNYASKIDQHISATLKEIEICTQLRDVLLPKMSKVESSSTGKISMKFNEDRLEQAVLELFEAEGYRHLSGEEIHKDLSEVLLKDDLKQYLLNRYAADDITLNEIEGILRTLELLPASALVPQ